MKHWTYLLVLLASVCSAYGGIQEKHTMSDRLLSSFNKVEREILSEKIFTLNTNVGADSSEGLPVKQKKRNRKGVKPVLFCIDNDVYHRNNYVDNNIFPLIQLPYCFQAFPGNGQRGPPSYL